MAGMDLSTRRDAPGISVFWLILGMGALVALLIGLAVVLSERTTAVVESGADPEMVTPSSDAEAQVQGMSVPGEETAVDAADFTIGPDADIPPARPEVAITPQDLEVVVDPDFPLGPESPRPNTEEVLVIVPVPATDLVVTVPATTIQDGPIADIVDEGPVPGSPPVVPTPSGPAGADGNPLTPD